MDDTHQPKGNLLRVGLMQLETNSEQSKDERFSRFQTLLPPKDSCDLVILPELWLQGAFEYAFFSKETTTDVQSYLNRIAKAAKKNNYWIHSGSFLTKHKNEIFNQAFLFDNTGCVRATYKKNYVFGFGSGESKIVSEGSDVTVIKSPWGNMGFAICYDLRFPELFRKMLFAGAEVLIISSAWPASRINEWKNLVTARAIENQCLVIACNGVGSQTEAKLGGVSLIVAANGAKILELEDFEEIKIHNVDNDFTEYHRTIFPVLMDIKEIYNKNKNLTL